MSPGTSSVDSLSIPVIIEVETGIFYVILTATIDIYSHSAWKSRHFTHPSYRLWIRAWAARTRSDERRYLFGVNECRRNAQDRDYGDAERIVIVVVTRPQDYTGNLKDIKWVYYLKLVNTGRQTDIGQRTYFIYKKWYRGFCLNINVISAEQREPLLSGRVLETVLYWRYPNPRRIPPVPSKIFKKSGLRSRIMVALHHFEKSTSRVKRKPRTAIVQHLQCT